MRSKKEVSEMMDKAAAWTEQGRTAVHGMSYEEGVEAALRWALGDWDDEPIESDPE